MMPHRLTAKSYSELQRFLSIQNQTLGSLLQEADLVSSWQIESALQDKLQHPNLRIGEILAQKNIIKPETADFFAQDWSRIVIAPEKDAIGYYLQQAAILDRDQIETILAEQRETGVRFGTVAVFQGFIRSTTLDFFLANLYPEELHASPFVNMHRGSSLF